MGWFFVCSSLVLQYIIRIPFSKVNLVWFSPFIMVKLMCGEKNQSLKMQTRNETIESSCISSGQRSPKGEIISNVCI